jgi:hypothetical protein
MLGPSITGASWCFPLHGRPLHPSVASEHTPLRARHPVVRRWSGRTNGEAAPLARVAPSPHHRHGGVVHPATHRVLCGQRTTSSALEFSAAAGVLGRSKFRRDSDSDLGAPETYEDAKRQRTGTATRRTLNSRRSCRRLDNQIRDGCQDTSRSLRDQHREVTPMRRCPGMARDVLRLEQRRGPGPRAGPAERTGEVGQAGWD